MNLITVFDVADKDENELSVIFSKVASKLEQTAPGSAERSAAIGSLHSVQIAMIVRKAKAPRP